jgi:hypothetical protein
MMLVPITALCLDADAASLIRRLAHPAPATIAFAEVRFSALLKEPLVVSGELSYQGANSLDRRVTQPYNETTEIRGESVRVLREGETTRSFALKRSPELRGLLTGFSALLAGDASTLEGVFDAKVTPDGDAWTLELTPTDARLRKRLKQIAIQGHNDMPRCFTIMNADGGASVMLLGEAAATPVPKGVTQDNVLQRCRGAA